MSITKASLNLTRKFIEGLKNYDLSYEQISKQGWKYCGGDTGSHLNYFKLFWDDDDLPPHANECVYGHQIKYNCYITDADEEQILVLGNCCIKKFVPKSSRTCEKCGEPHKNRVVNRCHACRVGVYDGCGKKCNKSYKKCYNCAFE
jgi:hypothetical protein